LEVQVENNAFDTHIERKPDTAEIYYRAGDSQRISCSLVTRLV
jgi:hypothetical protein